MNLALRLWLAVVVAVLITWIGIAASGRSQDEVLAALHEYGFTQDPVQREELERGAAALFSQQLGRRQADRKLIAAAYAVLRQCPDAERHRGRLETAARGRLETALAQPHPDPDELRSAYDLLILAGADDAREQQARIAALAGDRGDRARALGAAANALRDAAGTPAGDAALAALVTARDRLLEPAPALWALRETPTVATALEDASQAALIHVEALVAATRPADAGSRPAAVPAAARDRLRAAWSALQAIGIADRCDAQTLAGYAAATRRQSLDGGAWAVLLVLIAILVGEAAVAMRRLWRGPRPIDPGAETIQNEAPIDVDTEADTLEAARSRSGHETTIA